MPTPQNQNQTAMACPIVPPPLKHYCDVHDKQPNRNVFVTSKYPGGGKTFYSFAGLNPATTLAVAPTNKRCSELRKEQGCDALTVAKVVGLRVVGDGTTEASTEACLDKDTDVVLDELYQSPLALIAKVLRTVANNPQIRWIANGDPLQNTNGETLNNVHRDAYLASLLPRYFPDRLTSTGTHRYPAEADKALLVALYDALWVDNLTPLMCVERFQLQTFTDVDAIKAKGVKLAVTHTNASAHAFNQLHSVPDAVGMSVMAKTWTRGLETNTVYEVEAISPTHYTIGGTQYRKTIFRLPYSQTCFVVQGDTIDEPYAIFDVTSPLADKKWFWTALTRCRSFKQVWVYVGAPLVSADTIHVKLAGYATQDKTAGRVGPLITRTEVMELMKTANFCCSICYGRVELCYEPGDAEQWSLDRINNDVAHTNTNVRLAHLGCNRADGLRGKKPVARAEDSDDEQGED